MQELTHIIIGHSAYGTLRLVFRTKQFPGKALLFPDDLSIGPIYHLDEDRSPRYEWMRRITDLYRDVYGMDDNAIREEYEQLYAMPGLGSEDCIVIWHGENPMEQTALRYLVHRLRNHEILEMDVSRNVWRQHDGWSYKARSVGECSPEDLEKALLHIEPMPASRKAELSVAWEVLNESEGSLRILEKGRIVEVNGHHYDPLILCRLTEAFTPALRVVGAVLGNLETIVGDGYISHRLLELVRRGLISWEGDITDLRNLKVKKKNPTT